MFPIDLSRAVAALGLGVVLLSGCASRPPVEASGQHADSVVSAPSVTQWLDQLDTVDAMDMPAVRKQLEQIDKTASADQLFMYGALNQRLQDYDAWAVARDAFQNLQENEILPKELRQLAGILRQYNQSRINGHARYRKALDERTELQAGLQQAEAEKIELEQKIRALTELETAISTRQEE